ncbi:MAG: zinc ribbon domain-containing protein [Desulfurivibrionaceae bacterium]
MRKCPYCAEDIQVDAQKCKHCGEWLIESNSHREESSQYYRLVQSVKSTLPFQIDQLCLEKDFFLWQQQRYSYNDVTGLTYYYSIASDTVGLQRTSFINLYVHIRDNIKAALFDQGRFAGKATAITQAYEVLRMLTIQSRYAYYVSLLKNHGFIDYTNDKDAGALKSILINLRHIGSSAEEFGQATLDSVKKVHIYIHNNGTVTKDAITIDLKAAKSSNGILLGNSKVKFLSLWDALGPKPLTRNPYEIALSEKGLGLFSSKIVFEATRDFDIIADIITSLK